MEELSDQVDQILANIATAQTSAPFTGSAVDVGLVSWVLDAGPEALLAAKNRGQAAGTAARSTGTRAAGPKALALSAGPAAAATISDGSALPQSSPRAAASSPASERSASQKEVLQWCEDLGSSFTKAWVQRVDPVDFAEKACYCGERLMHYKQYALAHSEIYSRLCDRVIKLREDLLGERGREVDVAGRIRAVSVYARFCLGKCMSLYQQTIHHDEGTKRPDTVDVLRDVLSDILGTVRFVNEREQAVREEVYWAIYNAALLALRVSRWLRLHGFGGPCVKPMWWLAQAMGSCLPLMAVQMLPFRSRFILETVSCAESAQQISEAASLCDGALSQIEADEKLETMLPPVPEETSSLFEAAKARLLMMKAKYDFWSPSGSLDVKQLVAKAQALTLNGGSGKEGSSAAQAPKAAEKGKAPGKTDPVAPAKGPGASSPMILSLLLEVLQVQHGLPDHFGIAASASTPANEAASAQSQSRFNRKDVLKKKLELIEEIKAIVVPLLESVEAATVELKRFTADRLAYEKDAEARRAGTIDEQGPEASDPLVAPERPTSEQLESWGIDPATNVHRVEEAFPLSAHLLLIRECLRHEMQSASAGNLSSLIRLMMRGLALRLRYRHFLSPPLIDIDVVVSAEKKSEQVELPDKYDLLTDDLNAHSIHNRQLEAEEAAANLEAASGKNAVPGTTKKKRKDESKHVFIIGQRFDAWEAWVEDSPPPVKQLCNPRVVFGPASALGQGYASLLAAGREAVGPLDPKAPEFVQEGPWIGPYSSGNVSDAIGMDPAEDTAELQEHLLRELEKNTAAPSPLIQHRALALPIEAHLTSQRGAASAKGATDERIPFLLYSVYDEQRLWMLEEETNQGLTLKPADATAPQLGRKEDDEIEALLPAWCPLLESAGAATTSMVDLAIFATKCVHTPPPSPRFNAMIRRDLKQTPSELVGQPFQTYIYFCAVVNAPSHVFIAQQLRILRAHHALYCAENPAPSPEPTPAQAAPAVPEKGGKKAPAAQAPPTEVPAEPPTEQDAGNAGVLKRLLDMAEILERAATGPRGQLFVLDSRGFIEDICAHLFQVWVWPRLQAMQETKHQHEVGERPMSEKERQSISEWSVVLLRLLPLVLHRLEVVKAVDAVTLASAAHALSRLLLEENDPSAAQLELGRAIARLEREIANDISIVGPQPSLDRHLGTAISFDPPSLRPLGFSIFPEAQEEPPMQVEILVRHATIESDQLQIPVRSNATMLGVKQALAAYLGRPEILKQGRLARRRGTMGFAPFKDFEKLGSRRTLFLLGVENIAGNPTGRRRALEDDGGDQPAAKPKPDFATDQGVAVEEYKRKLREWNEDWAINIEVGKVQASQVKSGSWSAMWCKESVDDVYSADVPDHRLQVENTDKERAGQKYFRLANRWKPAQKLYVKDGKVEAGPVNAGDDAALWREEDIGGGLINLFSKQVPKGKLHAENDVLEVGIVKDETSAQWRQEKIGGGYFRITLAPEPERRLATDGQRYSREDFLKFYGGLAEWDSAGPAKGASREGGARISQTPEETLADITGSPEEAPEKPAQLSGSEIVRGPLVTGEPDGAAFYIKLNSMPKWNQQAGWYLGAQRASGSDKRNDQSSFVCVQEGIPETIGGQWTLESASGSAYYLRMKHMHNYNEQAGWYLGVQRDKESDLRNEGSTFVNLHQGAPESCAAKWLLEPTDRGNAFYIKLYQMPGPNPQAGWYLGAQRSLAQDRRSDSSTFVSVSEGSPESCAAAWVFDPAAAIVLEGTSKHERVQQDQLCLLTRLYERWIDCSLRLHLRNQRSSVKRPRNPDDVDDGPSAAAIGGQNTSTKVSLSNEEANIVTRLGENPYLRCLFFVAVAKRRPEVAVPALGKACQELEAAATNERDLWVFCNREVGHQQRLLRAHGADAFALREFTDSQSQSQVERRKALPSAYPPLLHGRTPFAIRLRVPPLPKSPKPTELPSSLNLRPPIQEYSEKDHSQKLGMRSTVSPSDGQKIISCMVYGKPVGTGTAVSELHRDLQGTGLRYEGYAAVEISGLKPNTNYSFASNFFEGFTPDGPVVSSISEPTPAIGTYFPLPLVLLRIEVCKAILQAGKAVAPSPGSTPTQTPIWRRAWPLLFDSLCERTSAVDEYDSYGLRMFRLRLEVVDRLPPACLAAFAELLLLKNAPAGKMDRRGDTIPCSRSVQQAVLNSAGECVLAVDTARRAGSSFLTFQAVSLTAKLVGCMLQYRTKPKQLLSLLTKCATALESFEPQQQCLSWFAECRVMVTYLLHHVTVICVQLRQVLLLSHILEKDAPERYEAHESADPGRQDQADASAVDQVIEWSLLGAAGRAAAERKARAALRSQESAASDELLRLVNAFAERNFTQVAKDAAQLVLQEERVQAHPLPLALVRSAVARAWEVRAGGPFGTGGEEEAVLQKVSDEHPLSAVLVRYLADSRKRFIDFNFLLRALPTARVKGGTDEQQQGGGDEATAASAVAAETGEEGVKEEEEEEPAGDVLREHSDTAVLAQLELMRAAPVMAEICSLKFNWHDLSRFKFFDLEQIKEPELEGEEDLDITGFKQPGFERDDDDTVTSATRERDVVDKLQSEDTETRTKGFQSLQMLLQTLARAAAYAGAKRANTLLQMVVIAALNALLIVGPSPAECVPEGSKSDPQDIDPDKYVGAPVPEESSQNEPDPASGDQAKQDVDVWLNLSLIADFAADAFLQLKRSLTLPAVPAAAPLAAPPKTGSNKSAPQKKGEARVEEKQTDEEVEAIRVADEAAKEASADEEPFEFWWDKTPELDVTSTAKLVAFATLCLYHMRRWNCVIKLSRKFNEATCFKFATTFLPLMIGAQREMCKLSSTAIENNQRYLAEAKSEYDADYQVLLKTNKKLLRHLQMHGELSEPEKLFKLREAYYGGIGARQQKLHIAWSGLLNALTGCHALVNRAVPAAMEQLRQSRMLLATFLEDRQKYSLEIRQALLVGEKKVARERTLRVGAMGLISSYRKAVELLRKRQMTEQVVQALHELGNLQWLEGETAAARSSWSDALDTAYQQVAAIQNWQKCVKTAVKPPQNTARAEVMLLSVVILEKHTRLAMSHDATARLHAALLASSIVEAVISSSLPHPLHRASFVPDKYRLREIFFGLRETRLVLPPKSMHGGVDGQTFLNALAFFHRTLLAADYQPLRCLPLSSLHNYIATDICRHRLFAVRGRLMMARGLIRCRSLTSAWLTLFALARNQDLPRSPLIKESLGSAIEEAVELSPKQAVAAVHRDGQAQAAPPGKGAPAAKGAGAPPGAGAEEQKSATTFRSYEEPFSEHNAKALRQLTDLALPVANASDTNSGATSAALGAFNAHVFRFLQAEFLLCVCSYGRVQKPSDDAAAAETLATADRLLEALLKDVTGDVKSSEDFEVVLTKVDGAALGFDFIREDSHRALKIKAFQKEGSIFEQWNAGQNGSDKEVRPEDCIVEVNGAKGSPADLLRNLADAKPGPLKLLLRREMPRPRSRPSEEETELMVEIRLLRAWSWELRGDFGQAIGEVLQGMNYIRMLATRDGGVLSGQETGMSNIPPGSGEGSQRGGCQLRTHPGMMSWMMLRRRMVQLLVSQGRFDAAHGHIEQGLRECQAARDDATRIELLAAKVRIEVMTGRLIERHHDSQIGALPAAEHCLSLAAKSLPVPTISAVYTRLMLSTVLEQNPSLVTHESIRANAPRPNETPPLPPSDAHGAVASAVILQTHGKIVKSLIAKDLVMSSSSKGKAAESSPGSGDQVAALLAVEAARAGAEWQREHLRRLAEMVAQCAEDVDLLLEETAGFELRPSDRNSFFHFEGEKDEKPPTAPAFLQSLQNLLRERPASDSREPSNLYLELMPLRLHITLRLARIRLLLGDFAATEALLREAEVRMTLCVYLLPWLYVEFCALKLQWRRLKRQAASADAHTLPPMNDLAVKWLDPLVFASGSCPPTDNALFRTFLRRGQRPALVNDTTWVVEHVAPKAEKGEQYLRESLSELIAVLRVAVQEAGHDYRQLFQLLREGLEELLWVKGFSPEEGPQGFDLIFAFFCAIVSLSEACKALHFEKPEASGSDASKVDPKAAAKDPKGAKGGDAGKLERAVESEKLPKRVSLDLQRHLKRQAHEGAMAYSSTAQQEAQKLIPFRAVMRHVLALRRECDVFESIYHRERLLCDQLHVKLAKASDAYSKARLLQEEVLKELEGAPAAAPAGGDVLVHWVQPDVQDQMQPVADSCGFMMFLCSCGEGGSESSSSAPIVARCREVEVSALRKLLDGLWSDLGHCKVADAVTTAYMGERLRYFARVLRGPSKGQVLDANDERLDAALEDLLRELQVPSNEGNAVAQDAEPSATRTPEVLESHKVQNLLLSVTRLLDRGLFAARVAHPGLNRFLRVVVRPLSIFPV